MTTEGLREKLLEHKEVVEKALQKDAYRFHRYNIPFSLAIFHSDTAEALQHLGNIIRISDTLIPLDEHFICIIFDCVDHFEGFKAAENMLYNASNRFPHAKLSAGLTSISRVDEAKDLIYRAIGNLHQAMKEKDSSVEDDSVIDRLIISNFEAVPLKAK